MVLIKCWTNPLTQGIIQQLAAVRTPAITIKDVSTDTSTPFHLLNHLVSEVSAQAMVQFGAVLLGIKVK